MNPIFAAALEIQEVCRRRSWRFCFIGALAVQRWGEPRLTQDADLTLITGFGGEEPFVDGLLAAFKARRPDARAFALRYRVLLLEGSNGVPLDVSLGAMPFEERAVERGSAFAIGEGKSLQTCSAEDLIVLKAFAGRDKDWLDIEGESTPERSLRLRAAEDRSPLTHARAPGPPAHTPVPDCATSSPASTSP